MVYVVRYSATNVCVFSNCQEVELFVGAGSGMKSIGRQAPDKGSALNHPPLFFNVDADVVAVKAVGYVNDKKVAEHIRNKPGQAVALKINPWRDTIAADGSDFVPVTISAVDGNGTVVPDVDVQIRAEVKGPGRLIGDNPFVLRKGLFVLLAGGYYDTGTITFAVHAEGLASGQAAVRIVPVQGSVYFPKETPLPSEHLGRDAVTATGKAEKTEKPSVESGPDDFEFKPVTNAPPGAWVESGSIMIGGGGKKRYPLSIKGGEYQVYSGPWTDKPGVINTGDDIRIRVRSSVKRGETVRATLVVGPRSAVFSVTTQ
jgi:hypothetical protein